MSASQPERLLLTVVEAAAALGISRSCLYPRLDSEIPTVRVGRRVLIPRQWLERYVERHVDAWERGQRASL
jgi:excisionase family DNA binding protein